MERISEAEYQLMKLVDRCVWQCERDGQPADQALRNAIRYLKHRKLIKPIDEWSFHEHR